jgi:hypothetical protein
MDILHLKSLHRPDIHLPKLHLDSELLPRAATSVAVIFCLCAGVVFYLAVALFSALHAW